MKRTRRSRTIASLLLFSLFVATTATAQGDTTTHTKELCFRGQRAPACRQFMITELGIFHRLNDSKVKYTYQYADGTSQPYEIHSDRSGLSGEVGLMTNRSSQLALGASIMVSSGDGGSQWALKGRARHWLNTSRQSIDFGAGILQGEVRSAAGSASAWGTTADIAYNVNDLVAGYARADVLRGGGRTVPGLYVGIRGGSHVALAGSGVLALLGAAVIVLLAGWDD